MLKKPKWHACGKNIICILEFSLCRTAVKVLNRRTRVRILISATCQTEKSIRLTGGNNKFIPFQGQVHQIGRIILHYTLYRLHSDKIIIVLVASGLRTIRIEKVVPVMYVSSWNKHHKKGLDNSRKLQFLIMSICEAIPKKPFVWNLEVQGQVVQSWVKITQGYCENKTEKWTL